MTLTVRGWDDPVTWNDFTASVPMAHFQQSWQWGELAPELGGQAVRLGAARDGELTGAMQIFVNPVAHTGSTMLYVPRGPAVHQPDVVTIGALLRGARDVGADTGALGLRLEPSAPAGNACWERSLRTLGLYPTFPPSQPRSSWVLDISPDEDALLAGMKSKTRYNIRLAARKGVTVTEGTDADFDEFYALLRETAERDDFFVHREDVYRRMFALFREAGMFALLLARYQGRLIAAVTLVRFGPTCWYLHGASSNVDRNVMAPYLLQWEGIRWAKGQGCREYDFRAVPDLLRPDQDMYGVYRFKEGFGGHQLTTMHTYAQAYRPGLFGLWQLFFSGRFALGQWQRRRHCLPVRQFA
ncbi:MAG TPA: peptidoglycan bridge formation glycyltransferase FemA/FemB family protein [Chloroflexota bacterium]|nr:peptidoglycan bridge formation glycyltransferase FemA/FemB family protein [Chloroflexota bacterium]